MKLVSEFLKVSSNMSSHEIISLTGLQESDLSRLRVMSIEQFSIDKIIEFVLKLGFSVKIDIGKSWLENIMSEIKECFDLVSDCPVKIQSSSLFR